MCTNHRCSQIITQVCLIWKKKNNCLNVSVVTESCSEFWSSCFFHPYTICTTNSKMADSAIKLFWAYTVTCTFTLKVCHSGWTCFNNLLFAYSISNNRKMWHPRQVFSSHYLPRSVQASIFCALFSYSRVTLLHMSVE